MSVVYLLAYAVATMVVLWSLGGLMTARRSKTTSHQSAAAPPPKIRSAA